MFSIETTEDVKLLRELTRGSDELKIRELEERVDKLSQDNLELTETAQKQMTIIQSLAKKLVTADECRDIVFDLIGNKSKPKNLSRNKKVSIVKNDTDEFDITNSMSRKFNKVLVAGNKLIHHTVRNQKMDLPISTLELLALMEVYQGRKRTLINKDCEKFCKLFKINKVQFGKLYYNIKEGSFFDVLEEIDKQIKKTNFRVINDKIYIVTNGKNVDTEIDMKLFNYLTNIYVNSSQPYSTIYKLSKEYKKINPIYLLAILKRNSVIK